MIFVAGVDGTVQFVNKRWLEFSGYASTAALDRTWQSIVHPDDLDRMLAAVQHSLETGLELSAELRMRKADGTYSWILANASPFRDASDLVVRWYGTAVDIDARLHVEARLADSERRFRALAEAIPVICWTADASGWIDWYNQRWYEFTGQTPDEAIGWGWQAVHHPDDFLEVMRRWPRSIATGEPFEMEFRLRRFDGAFHWFLTRVEPLRNEDGHIVRWYGSHVDIDEQKQALERTKRVAETLQDMFLPKRLPQRSDLRLDAVYLSAEKDALVGGDWLDAFETPDGRIAFSMGDVAGHGLQASLLAGLLRQAIFTLAFRVEDPAAILKEADHILRHQEPDTMVTALVGFIDRSLTTMTYASAGHPPPLIGYTAEEPAQVLSCGGPPLGLGIDLDLTTYSVPIRPDAVVAIYTDGMTEFSRDVVGAELKLRATVGVLVGNTTIARPAVAVQEIVFNDAPTRDDAALLLMQFSHVDPGLLRASAAPLEKTWRFHSSDAFSAHASRHEIITYLRQMAADPDEVFTAELVLGEVLANTVEHAPGLVEVHIDWTGEVPVVTIRDSGPGLKSLTGDLPDDVMEEGGRGVFLIRSLSKEASAKTYQGRGAELRVVLQIRRKKQPPSSFSLVEPGGRSRRLRSID
jgi:PAS domain S-box-containing protein